MGERSTAASPLSRPVERYHVQELLYLATRHPDDQVLDMATAELKQRETEAAYTGRDAQQSAERSQIRLDALAQTADQAPAVAHAAGVDAAQPTAMMLAMERARVRQGTPAAASAAPVSIDLASRSTKALTTMAKAAAPEVRTQIEAELARRQVGSGGTTAPVTVGTPPVTEAASVATPPVSPPDQSAQNVSPVFDDPGELSAREYDTLAKTHGLTDAQRDAFRPKPAMDAVTGFFRNDAHQPTIQRAKAFAEQNGVPAFYVDGDIANLGGLNDHFGNNHAEANKVFRAMTDIFRDELSRAGAKVVPIRHGGDEVSAVVVGASEQAVQSALANITARISAYAKENGLSNVKHPKGKAPGIGLYSGYSLINGNQIGTIIRNATQSLDAGKKAALQAATKEGEDHVGRTQGQEPRALEPDHGPGRTGPGRPGRPGDDVAGGRATAERGRDSDHVGQVAPTAEAQGVAEASVSPTTSGETQHAVEHRRDLPAQKSKPGTVKSPIMRRDDLVGSIMRVTGGRGIAAVMAPTVAGDSANNVTKLRGLFRVDGVQDLDDLAMLLREEEGYDVRDAAHLEVLIREAAAGNVAIPMVRQEEAAAAEAEKQYRASLIEQAKAMGIKTVARKFADIEREVLAKTQAEADEERAAVQAFDDVVALDDDQINALLQMAADTDGSQINGEWITKEQLIDAFEPIGEAAADQDEQGAVVPGEAVARKEGGSRQEGGESPGATQDFRLTDQTNEEAAAEFARGKQANESLSKGQIDREAEHFTLAGQSQPASSQAPTGGQSGLFTPDGSVTAAADAVTSDDIVRRADAITPAPAADIEGSSPAEQARAAEHAKITDFGEKIGGARKDKAKPLGPRAKIAKAEDERPTWARKFHVLQVSANPGRFLSDKAGQWQIMQEAGGAKGAVKPASRQFFATEQEALDAIPLVAVSQRHAVYYQKSGETTTWGIYRNITERKRALVKGGFADRDAAMRYMAEHPAEILEHKFAFPERPWLDRIERIGPARHSGDVTPVMFQEAFGFRGGEFGNWNLGGDGQAALNHAYDALLDLADAIGVPPKAISLNGELAIAFGARGTGGKNSAAAHYEPGYVVINLTKIKGAGSAAHEWWHAVDHFFARNGGWKDSHSVVADRFATDGQARPELIAAIKEVVDAIQYSERSTTTDADLVRQRAKTRIDEANKSLDYYLADLRQPYQPKKPFTAEQLAQWDQLAAKLRDGDLGAEVYIENPSKQRGALGFTTGAHLRDLNALYKAATGRSFLRNDPDSRGRRMHWMVKAIADNKVAAATQADVTTTSKGRSEFYLEARNIDGYRTGDYWSTPEEMGARAFEAYIFDKLTAGERRSDYLVYAVENRYYDALGMKPYPEGEERQRIDAAFDRLFAAIQTKETDKGVAMFSREDTTAIETAVQRMDRFVSEFERGSLRDSDTQVIGQTPVVLQALGADNLHFQIDGATVRKVLGGKHKDDISAAALRNIASSLYDPLAIFQSTSGNGFVFLTEVTSNSGNPVVAAIHVNKHHGGMLINDVASIHEKTDAERSLSSWIGRDLLLYARNENDLSSAATRHLLPASVAELMKGHIHKVLTEDAVVNRYGSRYSRSEAASGGTVETVRTRLVDELGEEAVAALESDGRLQIISAAQARRLVGEAPEAFYYRGTAYLVADQLRARRILPVILHEIGEHHALAEMLGEKEYSRLRERIRFMRTGGNAEVVQVWDSVRRLYPELEEGGDTFMKEVLAKLGEYPEVREKSWWRDLLDQLRLWLTRNGFGELAQAAGLDVHDLLRAGVERTVDQARKSATGRQPAVAYSRDVAESRSDEAMFSRNNFGALTNAQEQALERVGGIVQKQTVRQRLTQIGQSIRQNFVQGMFDQFAPIRDVSEKAYIHSRLSKGSDGTLEALMLIGRPQLSQDGVPDVNIADEGFAHVLQELQGEHDRFLWWVAAQRAENLQRVGMENLFTAGDIQAIKSLAQGAMPDGTTPRAFAYSRALKKLNDFNDAVLKLAEDSGLVDPAARQLFKDMPYVPFYRAMAADDGRAGPQFSSGLVNQSAWKKLKGGKDQLRNDLLANVLTNWSHLITASARNRAAVLTMAEAKNLGIAHQVPSGTKDSVRVVVNGKNQHWVVDDPHLFRALSAIAYVSPSWYQPFTAAKRWLTTAVTVNPTFKVRNLIRDSVSAIATADLSYNPGKNLIQGFKATSKKSQTFASMLAGGGVIRFGTMIDGDTARHARKLVDKGVAQSTILNQAGWKRLTGQAGKLWDTYQELGDRAENINRAALYEQLVQKGVPSDEANFMARDLMDFSMSGNWEVVRFLAHTVPFLNARLQGLYKLGRAATEDPARFGVVISAVALASTALMLAYMDDDDWKKREDWDRDNYWWFKIGGVAFRIPKPFEVGAIGTLAERTLERIVSPEMTHDRYMQRLSHMFTNTFAMNPVPQLLKPWVDIYANRDSFTNRPVESMGMERLRPEDRVRPDTSILARWLSAMHLPDLSQLATGRLEQLSPVQVDHLMRAYFAWIAVATNTTIDTLVTPLTDTGDEPDMKLRDTFFVGNFVETLPSNQSRYVTQLYEQSKEIEQAHASYRDALRRGDKKAAAEIKDDEGDNLRRHQRVHGIREALSEIAANERRVRESKTLSGETKRRLLDMLAARKDKLARRVQIQ